LKYFLGIDQGGTKTQAALADQEGHILGSGLAGGACHSTHGMARAMQAVEDAARQASRQAGVPLDKLELIAGGLTGIDWPEETDLLKDALHKLFQVPRERVHLVNDCIIAMRAATSAVAGAVLCAGTGLNCAVRDGRGGEYIYGFYIAEEDQGGMALGRRALQAVYDAGSGVGAPTALTAMILGLTGQKDTDALLRLQVTGGLRGSVIAEIPRLIEKAALSGDEISTGILRRFGRNAARYVTAGLERFGLQNRDVEVVLSGSVFKCEAPMLLDTIRESILAAAPRARVLESEFEPIVGALLLGLDHLNGGEAESISSHIKRDAQRFHMIRIS